MALVASPGGAFLGGFLVILLCAAADMAVAASVSEPALFLCHLLRVPAGVAVAAAPAEAVVLLVVGPLDPEAGFLLGLVAYCPAGSLPDVCLGILGEFLLLEGELVHLHVLVAGDLVAEALDELLGGELLDLLRTGCACDVIDLSGLEELPEDELSSPVSVDEGGTYPLPGEVLDGLGDVGSLHRNGVLDACAEEVEDVGPALDDDDGLGGLHGGSCGEAFLSVGGDLLYLQGLPDVLRQVGTAALGLLHEDSEEFLRTLGDLLPLGDTYVLDADDLDRCLAGTDAVDGLEGRGDDCRLHLVEGRRHVDDTLGFSAFGDDLDFDPADPSGLLEVPQVEVVAEEAFGLSEDGSHDVGFVDDSVCVDLRFYLVFD